MYKKKKCSITQSGLKVDVLIGASEQLAAQESHSPVSVGSPRAARVVGISRVGGLCVHGRGGGPGGRGGRAEAGSFPGSRVSQAQQRPGGFPPRKHQPAGDQEHDFDTWVVHTYQL